MNKEQDFHQFILTVHQTAVRETGYKAPIFKRMVAEYGALKASKQLLSGEQKITEGLKNLVMHSRLDLSVEASVIKPEWRELFERNELEVALKRLKKLDYQIDSDIEEYLKQPPKRKSYSSNLVVRDTSLPLKVKQLYDYKCQVCGERIECGEFKYAEAAHIKPLGQPHNGEDSLSNLLCLCPNHHKEFDFGIFHVNPDLIVSKYNTKLNVSPMHEIDHQFLDYHRNWCFEES
ncbi:TPA: HNH endonuclease [Vibrio parahaemolyticus]|uniref:HNH endonuclease n=1 Tax=Vibrio parahaemolyticus TaxID=670 RepID=UPI001E390ABD|nr:HNH endonuclease [Vibrio parahaemolyticus]